MEKPCRPYRWGPDKIWYHEGLYLELTYGGYLGQCYRASWSAEYPKTLADLTALMVEVSRERAMSQERGRVVQILEQMLYGDKL